MTSDPAGAIQAGLYAHLTGDAGLAAAVYDAVPEGAPLPYVVVGELYTNETHDSAHGAPGRTIVATLHTWTRARSFKPGNAIGARLVALLDQQHDALDAHVEGHRVWSVSHEWAQTLRDPDPQFRHRIDRFRIRTRQDAA